MRVCDCWPSDVGSCVSHACHSKAQSASPYVFRKKVFFAAPLTAELFDFADLNTELVGLDQINPSDHIAKGQAISGRMNGYKGLIRQSAGIKNAYRQPSLFAQKLYELRYPVVSFTSEKVVTFARDGADGLSPVIRPPFLNRSP